MTESLLKEFINVDTDFRAILGSWGHDRSERYRKFKENEKRLLRAATLTMVDSSLALPYWSGTRSETEEYIHGKIAEREQRQRNLLSLKKSMEKYREIHRGVDETMSYDASISLEMMERTFEQMWGKYQEFMKEDFFLQ